MTAPSGGCRRTACAAVALLAPRAIVRPVLRSIAVRSDDILGWGAGSSHGRRAGHPRVAGQGGTGGQETDKGRDAEELEHDDLQDGPRTIRRLRMRRRSGAFLSIRWRDGGGLSDERRWIRRVKKSRRRVQLRLLACLPFSLLNAVVSLQCFEVRSVALAPNLQAPIPSLHAAVNVARGGAWSVQSRCCCRLASQWSTDSSPGPLAIR